MIPNRGPQLLAVDIAFVVMAVVSNIMRCFVRVRMVKVFGLDDWLMVLATLVFVLYASSSMVGVHYGTGRHHSDLSTEGIQTAKNCWWYCYLGYCTSTVLTKISIGCFLLRILTNRIHILIVYAAMGTTVVAGLTFFFVTVFQCYPVSYFWDKTQDGTCVNMDVVIALAFIYSVCTIISDLVFAVLPAFVVYNLQLKRGTKIALIPLLTMGVIASAAVTARLPFLTEIGSPDFLWATLDIAIWSTVEQGLSITAGSLAALRPLFQLIVQKFGNLTLPSQKPYGKSTPADSVNVSSRPKPSQNDFGMYKMSIVAETRHSDEESLRKTTDRNGSPDWPSHAVDDNRNDRGSEMDINWQSAQSNANDGLQIMVERSFHVTDEEWGSSVSRDDTNF
ncbi:hypothetical protein P153DRAFT_364488 [Dothidotthia symphoricarpi CBS 119687]|uniref:Rhodopsin domain-containing protein n=1 Tax=Dothidotthia symphoricarpi CBS 119687 TaxID=1392245 RepID=A0A6A6AMC5_9PLEO|nr:uncharacterized protein P153DRAFT_364488 [Dothidotthia symphoricarpi CBS 119687]KAF2132037.1 hypothetical protein P153DRAFT_364488 [Dothidotthia symphoricarpi CBS 119687]